MDGCERRGSARTRRCLSTCARPWASSPLCWPIRQGWIESDYYSNPDNDGNIGIRLFNLGQTPYKIERGQRFAQGMFIKYLIAENCNSDSERVGGIGSTGK